MDIVYRYHGSCRNSVLPMGSIRFNGRQPAAVQLAAIAPLVSRRQASSVVVSRRRARSVRRSNQDPGSRGLTRRHSASAVGQAGPPASPRGPCKSNMFHCKCFSFDGRSAFIAVFCYFCRIQSTAQQSANWSSSQVPRRPVYLMQCDAWLLGALDQIWQTS